MADRFDSRMRRVQQNAKLALRERMEERERNIITRMVQKYQAGKLDANQLFGAIATIAELRSIVTEVEHDQIAADREIEELTKGS